MRFLTAYIDPKTGRERLGMGADAQCPHHYASAENVIRYGLSKPAFPAGQYNIYRWPDGPTDGVLVATAYKRAS